MYILQNRLLKWALYCNAIYVLLLFLFSPDGINLLNISITSLLFLSAITIFFICIKNFKLIKQIPGKIRIFYYLLFFWCFITVVRSFSFSIQDWLTNFGNIYMAFAWIMPITLILGLKIENWKVMFKSILFMFTLMIFAFIFLPFFKFNEEWILLLRPINFILLIGIYHFGILRKLKFYFVIIIYLIIAYLGSRRLEFLFIFLVLLLLLIDKLSSISLRKSFIKYIILGFVIVFILVFTVGYEFVSNALALLIEFQDSRTFLFNEFFKDLSTSDKFLGRGSLGTYYSDFFQRTNRYYEMVGRKGWKGDDPFRITIEVGYLQMILKGGFIMLILNISVYLYASYVAIFKSNNKFIRRLGYFIFAVSSLSLIELRPTFTPLFIIFWIAIGTVSIKKYREMSDEEINKLIK
ncbi:hypothetical protein [Yeosuana sp. AK3]